MGILLSLIAMSSKSLQEIEVSRRRFLQSASLATASIGLKPITGVSAAAVEKPGHPDAPENHCLWYDRPAQSWMTEALPIGNGPMGAMLFGGTMVERIQFNEISLWSGDRMAGDRPPLDTKGDDLHRMGAYQAFGDIFLHLGHDFSKVQKRYYGSFC